MKLVATQKELDRLKDLVHGTENLYDHMDNKDTAILVTGKLLEIIKLMMNNAVIAEKE